MNNCWMNEWMGGWNECLTEMQSNINRQHGRGEKTWQLESCCTSTWLCELKDESSLSFWFLLYKVRLHVPMPSAFLEQHYKKHKTCVYYIPQVSSSPGLGEDIALRPQFSCPKKSGLSYVNRVNYVTEMSFLHWASRELRARFSAYF